MLMDQLWEKVRSEERRVGKKAAFEVGLLDAEIIFTTEIKLLQGK